MKKYQLFSLQYAPTFIMIDSTNQDDLEWALSVISKQVPQCQITKYQGFTRLIKKLDDKDVLIGSQLRTLLCETGWEPFAVTPAMLSGTPQVLSDMMPIYFFRKEITQD